VSVCFATQDRAVADCRRLASDALPLSVSRLIDMVHAWTAATEQPFISFEYFPPRTDEGVAKVRLAASTCAKWASIQAARPRAH